MWAGDSGLSILLTDAPDPAEVEPGDPRVGVVCLDCVLDDFPGIAVGLELAREYGVADLDDDGEWVVGDLSRLDTSDAEGPPFGDPARYEVFASVLAS